VPNDPGPAPAFPRIVHPPLAPLFEVIARLERAGLTCALGGSALLAHLHLIREVRDWDVTAEADLPAIRAALADYPAEEFGESGVHVDHKLTFSGIEVEVIARLAFRTALGVCRIPTRISERVHGIPMASPEAWAVAYTLLERAEKAELLFGHLATHGADREVCEALLVQPLPEPLARRVESLSFK
jgi:hypothetical protein